MSEIILPESSKGGVQIVVPLSGGAASGYIGCRAQENCEKPVCIFSDTKNEDHDTYRFLHEIVAKWGLNFYEQSDGRHLLEFFRQQKIIPARQIPACSIALKIKPGQAFYMQLPDDREYRIAMGYGPDEEDRAEDLLKNWKYPSYLKPTFPLIENNVTKPECIGYFLQAGVALPRVYKWRRNANCRFCKNYREKDWVALAYYDRPAFDEADEFEKEAQQWDTPGRWMQDGPLLSELVIPEQAPSRKGRRKLAMAEPAFSFHSECGACSID